LFLVPITQSDPIGIATLHAAFEMFFEDNPRVIVDPDVSPFFKHEFGRNLIAGAHGDKLKPAQNGALTGRRMGRNVGQDKVPDQSSEACF
jgi:hypothetical protein